MRSWVARTQQLCCSPRLGVPSLAALGLLRAIFSVCLSVFVEPSLAASLRTWRLHLDGA